MTRLFERIQLLIYAAIVVAAIAVIYYAFMTGRKRGLDAGSTAPRSEKAEQAESETDSRLLRIPTPELVSEGQAKYMTNCSSCHGIGGEGNGPKAAQLKPPPRDFVEEEFKFGTKPLELFNTVTKGIPGTSMPSFMLLSERDRWSIIHYIRTLIPNPAPDDPEALAELKSETRTGKVDVNMDSEIGEEKKRIPIQLAMLKLSEAQEKPEAVESKRLVSAGAVLFDQKCASCHGAMAQGDSSLKQISPRPSAYVVASPLVGHEYSWLNNKAEFENIIVSGIPGRFMPGFGNLTRAEIDSLYGYLKKLNMGNKSK
jgi:mono/diheme cytochrome c family protein